MKPFLKLKPVHEVIELINNATPLSAEKVKLEDAAGRILYKDFIAPSDLPGFNRSSMDGFAVRASDVFGASESQPALLEIAGSCVAGKEPDFRLNPGEAAIIVTGAPIPEGADAVVMIEDSRPLGSRQVELIRSVTPGENIIEADEDAQKNQVLIKRGRQIRAQESGILAAFGISAIEVYRRPTVAIISTGDEIVPAEIEPGPCKLRDVNSWSVAALCKLHSAIPCSMGIVRDERAELDQKLREALARADVVIVSGGSSAGMRDLTVDAFLGLPDAAILAHGIAMRPGKPFILAKSGHKYLLGLPGHVTSALVCAHVFLEPLLSRLQGKRDELPQPWIDATLSCSVASAQGRRDYIRCRLEYSRDGFIACPLKNPSAVLSGLLEADGLIICPENSEGLAKGSKVKFYLLQ